jgi:hypothetical protein
MGRASGGAYTNWRRMVMVLCGRLLSAKCIHIVLDGLQLTKVDPLVATPCAGSGSFDQILNPGLYDAIRRKVARNRVALSHFYLLNPQAISDFAPKLEDVRPIKVTALVKSIPDRVIA